MLESSTKHPSRPPPTLHSLPTEILSQIVTWLDRNSAIVLARTARRFTPLAEQRIWQQLDLRLHPNFGEHPLIVPHARDDTPSLQQRNLYTEWKEEEGWRAEARHKAGLREKMRTILFRADERRAGMVREVTLIPRVCSVAAQISILDLASSSLRKLAIETPSYQSQQCVAILSAHNTLDHSLSASKLYFPCLTHILLGYRAIHSIGMMSLLCSSSPNLVSLDVGREVQEVLEDDPPPFSFAILKEKTKLRQFRILRDNDEDLPDEEEGNLHVLAVLKQSPLLRDLAIDTSWFTDAQEIQLFTLVGDLTHLRNLYFAGTLGCMYNWASERVLSSGVSSLVVISERRYWWYMFMYLPNAPSLRALYLDTRFQEDLKPPPAAFFPEPTTLRPMIPAFAAGLRRCPRLCVIHTAQRSGIVDYEARIDLFDRLVEVAELGVFTGAIRSFTHCGAEVLHARMLERYIEVSDEALPPEPDIAGPQPDRYCYIASDGSDRVKNFKALPQGETVWTDYTDFEGLKVPTEIIGQMRRVEGVSEREWEGRGIEVSEAAWKVLTDWRDEVLAGR